MLLVAKDLLLKTGALWLSIALSGIYGVYYVVKPTAPEYSYQQTAALETLSVRLEEWVSDIGIEREKTVVLTFERDAFGTVTDTVRNTLWRSDRFDLVDYTIFEKLRKRIQWTFPTFGTREKVLETARRRDARYAVWGRVLEFSDIKGEAALRLSVEVMDRATSRVLKANDFDIRQGASSAMQVVFGAEAERADPRMPVTLRILLWGLFTILLPIATFPLARLMLERDSNLANLSLVGGYAGCSLLAAYVMLARSAGDWLGPLFLLFALGFGVFYYWHILSMFQKKLV